LEKYFSFFFSSLCMFTPNSYGKPPFTLFTPIAGHGRGGIIANIFAAAAHAFRRHGVTLAVGGIGVIGAWAIILPAE
jgi:hypothetical protein